MKAGFFMARIPLSRPDITARERRAVLEVLRTPHLSLGPRLEEFEQAGARYAGRTYAVAVNSGTSGLHLIMKALGITRGDLVITTPFSFIASANCILFEGARPVFADIDERTLNISLQAIEDLLKRRRTKRIKAILAVDVFGHPADWDGLYELARRYGLQLIEDSCEALGAEYQSPADARRGRWPAPVKAGSFGTASTFAFYPNKQITTGEGGLILTDSKKIYELCRSLRNQGRGEGTNWFNHVRLGYNYRLSDINCVLGISQLQRIEEILAKRSRVARLYTALLTPVAGLRVPWSAPQVKVSWFVYVIRLSTDFSRGDRDAVIRELGRRGIEASNYFAPIHLQPFYRKMFGYKRGDFPVTEQIADRTIALPFFNNLKRGDAAFVVENLKDILRKVG